MTFKFAKMQALGNDFVVIDGVSQSLDLSPEKVRLLADRHRGIGFDQLLVVVPAKSPEVDFCYRIFNADGTEVGQCGNGARCLARFIRNAGLSDKEEVVVETLEARLRLRCLAGNEVSVSLGVPRFEPEDIPHQLRGQGPEYILKINERDVEFRVVNVGNPHVVIKVENPEAIDVPLLGQQLSTHPDFAQGANVGFVSIDPVKPNRILLRVYERGVGETQACGSGAAAAAIIALSHGWSKGLVTVRQAGGDMQVQWDGEGHEVWLTGPADWVFRGVWI